MSDGYYYPTLHQYKIELEDTLTSLNDQAYFRYDESEFPGFSWRGFAVFSQAQVKNVVSVKHRVALIETLITVSILSNLQDKDRRYQIIL